jgi:prevent-host-death family protein
MGVREAKAKLSRLLQDVRRGGAWVITERGKPIARLVPIDGEAASLEERIRRLEIDGVLGDPPKDLRPLPPPLRVEPGLAQRLLAEDRGA